MKSEWHIGEFTAETEKKIENVLFLTGQQVASWTGDNLRANGSVVTSNLVNSITCATNEQQSELRGPVEPYVKPITNPNKLSVRVGTNVVYAARVELGFKGKDSLGRNYNQSPKPYLVPAIEEHKQEILNFIQKHINE